MQIRVEIVKRAVLLGVFFYIPAFCVSGQDIQENRQKVKVLHPAIHSYDSTEVLLVQQISEEKTLYYIDVESVSCGDNQCKIVPVRLFFNELGFYDGLQLKKGFRLEKAKGKRFKKKDYRKLDEVILNKNLGLAKVAKEKLVEKQAGLVGVDAVSGATTPVLAENEYVKGAVWTCYTLWHWVHGGIFQVIRNNTGNEKSRHDLEKYLAGDDKRYSRFALEQIILRKDFSPEITGGVLQMASGSNPSEQKLILEYVGKAPENIYFDLLLNLLSTADMMRVGCLNSLNRFDGVFPADYCKQLADLLPAFAFYQEINLMLSVFEKHNCSDTSVNEQVIALLERKDILVGRRAYWFLQAQDLSEIQQEKLDVFYEKFADYL